MSDFITTDEFNELTKKKEYLSFGDLTEKMFYKIINKEDIEKEYDETFILTLKDKDGNEYKVYAPTHLYKQLKDDDDSKIAYIRPLGLKRSKKSKHIQYHNYDLVFKEMNLKKLFSY